MEIETAASPCGSVWSACLKSTGSDGVGAGGADEHQLNPNLSQRPSGTCGLGAAGNGGEAAKRPASESRLISEPRFDFRFFFFFFLLSSSSLSTP